jgi:hypothetical protein
MHRLSLFKEEFIYTSKSGEEESTEKFTLYELAILPASRFSSKKLLLNRFYGKSKEEISEQVVQYLIEHKDIDGRGLIYEWV